jgi:hypothetical protein
MREPRTEGVAPSLLGVMPRGPPLPEAPDCRAGVSSTNFRNWELFMAGVIGNIGSLLVGNILSDVGFRL